MAFPEIYCWLEWGYMCILLYVKLIQCSGVPVYLWSIGVELNIILTQRWSVVEFHISMVNWRALLFLVLVPHIFTIYMIFVRRQFFSIVFALCDYTFGSLKVVPWCSNTLDCWWKDMSKLVRSGNNPHSISIDLV